MFSASSVGVYFEGKNLYFAEVANQFGSVRIVKKGEKSVSFPAGDEYPDAIFATALHKALQEAGITNKPISLAIPENESMVRYFEMPLLPKSEWKASISFEAQKYVPFDLRELASDYKLIIDKKRKRMKIMFFAMRKEALYQRLAAFTSAQLTVASVEPSSASMMRCFYPGAQKDETEACAYLDLKNNGTANIVIARPNLMLMARHCVVTRSMEAQEKARAIPEAAIADLQLSFSYFYKNFKDEKVSTIILADAENVDIDAWSKQVQNEFSISTKVKNPLIRFGLGPEFNSGLMTACGAAMNSFSANVNWKINLIEKADRKKTKKALSVAPTPDGLPAMEFDREMVQKYVIAEVLALAAVFGIFYFVTQGRLTQKEKAVNAFKAAYPEDLRDYAMLAVGDLEMKRNDYLAKQKYIDNLIANRAYCTFKLSELPRSVPRDIQLESLSYSNKDNKEGLGGVEMQITGRVINNQTGAFSEVNKFMGELSKNEDFMKGIELVRVSSLENRMEDGISITDFSLDAVSSRA